MQQKTWLVTDTAMEFDCSAEPLTVRKEQNTSQLKQRFTDRLDDATDSMPGKFLEGQIIPLTWHPC